ncbi:putative disease resistance protein RGA4 [Quercus robur]|uniref:putative disease resistance protein RGA4 n=1 Tax=Quercus robur TaxID=38942 RepID=UPI002162D0B0|nr:putative disease resistance protein RGA4 [Quercus robur]XP_050280992.1 putative disease resistance protein RGA4 [Quercus robur]XP_050280993.1 putative disease resistance protein RGA4 [Quercus robur]XP_050280994.1 putative disease resistance protein RGA4 [Quercus robur]XP_050280995.1 putative disease resistance protein RGA4 [Quercus robur]XP_050280996.1 putative disease resistance protein RGA4 [Quercus robur]XP_050280997.1 putative disease resistance protein RGA4 [Quercus robur]XP_05028099
MAEGALVGVVKGITEKAGNLVAQEIGLLWGVKDEIKKLGDTVLTISAVIQDAEKKQQHNNQVRVWLERLNDTLYEADDLLDDISTEALRREVMTRNKKAKEVRIFFSKSNQLAFGLKMGHKVKEMNERLDAIKNAKGFHLDERPVETQVGGYRVRETHSFVRTEAVIGRDNDKEEIIKILLDPNVEESLLILPIVGLGGMGKTTLAQLIFNDNEVQNSFEQKLWVCVSDDFEVKVIVKKILECAQSMKPEDLEMNTLINDLKKEIDGKRYILVLDDVWNEDPKKWLNLKDLLMGGARGSRILVTTRNNRVAKITKTIQPYLLEGLDKEKSWVLFKQMAFENGQEPEKSIFKVVGKEILERCKGVPLAIRTIGSLLYFKNTEKEWLSFKDSELSKVPQEENDILPTLKLSYDHLPSYLKQCFAYCCLFPKDYRIHKQILIQMWMAQGFIRPLNQNQCLEDAGHEYIMDLLWRSFFQEVEIDEDNNILRFKMHDLMHDLAKLVAGSYSTNCYSEEEIIDEKTLHVSFGGQSQSQIPSSTFKARRIRTLIFHGKLWPLGQQKLIYNSALVTSFKFIRLLDLVNMGIRTIPSSIGKLKYLRYLDLSYNDIRMLPNSITRLHNLQTLKLSRLDDITKLPRDFTKLVNLRFLEITTLTRIPRGLEQMTSLQPLSVYQIIMKSDSWFKHNNGLKDLQGSNESKFSKLRKMSLDNYRGVKFPKWMSSLTALEEFSLYDCNKCQHLPPLEQFPYLNCVSLNKLDSLEYMSEIDYSEELSNSSFIPSLKKLELSCCPNLKGWWRQRRNSSKEVDDDKNHLLPFFPSLSDLEIKNCPKLTSMPLFPNVKRLKLDMCSLKPLKQTSTLQIANSSFAPLSKLDTLETGTLKEPLPNLSNLIYLDCRGPLPQGVQHLTTLKNMEIMNPTEVDLSNSWDVVEWQGLKSLKSLEISCCPNLISLSEGICVLISLQRLQINYCSKLKSLPEGMGGLTSLQTLKIMMCRKLESLPEGIGGLTSLQTLEIKGCYKLNSLPEGIGGLTSLHTLRFWDCIELKSLPEGIQGLTSLETLEIITCPFLLERCKRETGEDWPKISHIPNLEGELCQQQTN